MGGMSLAPNFDEHDTNDSQNNCWCFPLPSSDDPLTPTSESVQPSDNSTWTTGLSIEEQDSLTLKTSNNLSLSPSLLDQKLDNFSSTNTSPIRIQQAAGSHSQAFYQSLSRSTNFSSAIMPPKRTASAAKLDDNIRPVRKSKRASKPTTKKAATTKSPSANKKEKYLSRPSNVEDDKKEVEDKTDCLNDASDHHKSVNFSATASDDKEEEDVAAFVPANKTASLNPDTKKATSVRSTTGRASALPSDQSINPSSSVSKSASTPRSTVELPSNFLSAQATLQRMTPSITNLMMAAMKHNIAVQDVFPKAHRLAAQAYALRLEMGKIEEGVGVAINSIMIMERDFGWLGEEARKMGLVWK